MPLHYMQAVPVVGTRTFAPPQVRILWTIVFCQVWLQPAMLRDDSMGPFPFQDL